MKTKRNSEPQNEIDKYLESVPTTDEICQRLEQIEAEKKSLKKLLRIAHARDSRREASPC